MNQQQTYSGVGPLGNQPYQNQLAEAHNGDDWRPMSEAPRDGTVIEVRCTYGVAPWYGLYRWTGKFSIQDQNGELHEYQTEPRWAKVGDDASGFNDDDSFRWRPYSGNAAAYVDPTGGAQDDPAYWRRAVAVKHGLPADYFEWSWWQKLFRWW